MGKNFDMMFPSNTRFLTSILSLSSAFSIPPLDANACTCILFVGIWTLEKILCLVPHNQFNSVNAAFSSLTITFRKFADEKGPFPFFLQHMFLGCPMPKQKKNFKPQYLSYAFCHTWPILALN